MFSTFRKSFLLFAVASSCLTSAYCDNQTPTTTPVNPSQEKIPFKVRIEQAFQLPNGIQSYSFARHDGKWLLIAGRTNGLHGFNGGDVPENFPPQLQNQVVYVIDPKNGHVKTRSLSDPNSGLTQAQIDSIATTANQWNQEGKTLYLVGGYGFNTALQAFQTYNTLTAIDIPGLMHWVEKPFKGETAAQHIRQTENNLLQVTGGALFKLGKHKPYLLVFGQNFTGSYFGTGQTLYTQQVLRFEILDDGKNLSIKALPPEPATQDPNFRRRDLNVVPVISKKHDKLVPGLVALSGVFTPTTGIWTVPVQISAEGHTFMPDPTLDTTFKQGMNNYSSATLGLFSKKTGDMYTMIFGGLTFGFFQNGQFMTDPDIPFTNQVTTVKIDEKGRFSQYLMNAEYPVILSTSVNAGSQLLLGTSADFIPADDAPYFDKVEVVKLDKVKKDGQVVGYIVGGIASTVPDTSPGSGALTETTASPYVFKVIVEPTK